MYTIKIWGICVMWYVFSKINLCFTKSGQKEIIRDLAKLELSSCWVIIYLVANWWNGLRRGKKPDVSSYLLFGILLQGPSTYLLSLCCQWFRLKRRSSSMWEVLLKELYTDSRATLSSLINVLKKLLLDMKVCQMTDTA